MNRELTIESLAYGGNGVGRLDGKTVFVPLTLPGDRISWRPLRDKKRYIEGELVQVLEPGPGRCEPRCPLFGNCGGCQWQHLDYRQQLLWKQRLLGDALSRHARVEIHAPLPTVDSDPHWHYRNRVQFKCRMTPDGVVIGFFRRGSHYVIAVDHCPIARPEINDALDFLHRLVKSSPTPDRIPQLDVSVGDDGSVRIVCHHIGAIDSRWTVAAGKLAEERNFSLFLQQGRKSTLEHLAGSFDLHLLVDRPPLSLGYGPGGFAQVNSAQNRRLVDAVVSAAGLRGDERVLDLFCGMGNFSLPLARRAKRLVGVEDYPASIDQAIANARQNAIANTEFHAGDAADFMMRAERRFDLVLLDPPRTGAGRGAMQALLQMGPQKIIYVSCDPITLARDLRPLLQNGYRLLSSQPFDLFPQTYHIESLTLLVRRQLS